MQRDGPFVNRLNSVSILRKLPVDCGREESSRLLEATHCSRYQAAFSATHGARLRNGEVTALGIIDIDGELETLPIRHSRSRKYEIARFDRPRRRQLNHYPRIAN